MSPVDWSHCAAELCATCGAPFELPNRPGRKPKNCPACISSGAAARASGKKGAEEAARRLSAAWLARRAQKEADVLASRAKKSAARLAAAELRARNRAFNRAGKIAELQVLLEAERAKVLALETRLAAERHAFYVPPGAPPEHPYI